MINWDAFELENPEIEVRGPILLGEGWNCFGYRVNDNLVVKVPKTNEWGDLENEIEFLGRYADALPLPVPRPVHVQRRSEACEFGYAVYTLIPGVELNMRSIDTDTAYRDLGRFLNALHAQPLPTEHHFGVDDAAYTIGESKRLFEATVAQNLLSVRACESLELVVQRHQARYTKPKPLVFLHKDFGPSNILIRDRRIMGVIDFGNIVIGDADADFVDIWENMGKRALFGIAQAYGHDDPDALFDMVRDCSVVNGLEVLVDDAASAPPGVWKRLQTSFEARFGN